ncbi:LysR family transcriptional regulator [Brenneria corticis]|uniref:LysR family transcriptional regulator n=1 Tax=Brenneria corticis TaxID=2173106 RepID=A0A2U1U554_9GAMM|nr:LysR family transcriptional regulator [Brenneria sp. CFCC 11842]PWC16789.1 LysR family transcriptional regulator [Brenneria sp. CFCC 11842]
MKIDDIDAFVTLVQLKSTQATATQLGLTQPAVTRRVQNLELALGVQLLDRQTKPLKPTPLGLSVYRQCRRIRHEIDALRQLISRKEGPSGALRLGLPHSLAERGVMPALATLSGEYRDIRPQIVSHWGLPLLESLRQGELDAAVLMFPAGNVFPDGLHSSDLGPVPLAVVAPRDKAPPPRTLAECYPHGWVLNPEGCGFRAALRRALAEQGLPLRITMEVIGSNLQQSLIASGGGLGLLPRFQVENGLWADRLRILPLADFAPQNRLWLVHTALPHQLRDAAASFAGAVAAGLGLPAPHAA